MSLFSVPGFIKLFFSKENVETRYQSIHQIPVMTLQKQIAYIPKPAQQKQNIIFLHSKNIKNNHEFLAKFVSLKKKNYNVYLIPQQSPFETFDEIKQNAPKGLTPLGKMIINGEKQHPLIKFLKCNSQYFYDFRMLGANELTEETGAFIKNHKNQVKYLKKKQFEDFINRQLGIQKNPQIKKQTKQQTTN